MHDTYETVLQIIHTRRVYTRQTFTGSWQFEIFSIKRTVVSHVFLQKSSLSYREEEVIEEEEGYDFAKTDTRQQLTLPPSHLYLSLL